MAYAYAYTNALTNLGAAAFTNSVGTNDSTRARMSDTRMDKRYNMGASVASGSTIILDFGAAVALKGIALLNTNFAVQWTDAAVRIRAATDAAITTSVVTAKAATTLNSTAPKNKDHVLQFTTVTKRYWELTFTAGGSFSNASIGEIFAYETVTQLSRKSIYGGGEKEEIKTAGVDYENGNSRSFYLGGPVRSKRLPFQDLTSAEREELAAMWRVLKGEATPFLWIDSYEATAVAAAVAEQEVTYGRLKMPDFEWSENDYLLYQPPELHIRSLGREVGS